MSYCLKKHKKSHGQVRTEAKTGKKTDVKTTDKKYNILVSDFKPFKQKYFYNRNAKNDS